MGADSRMLEPQSSLPDLGNEGVSHVPPFCAEKNIRHQKDTALSLDLAKTVFMRVGIALSLTTII